MMTTVMFLAVRGALPKGDTRPLHRVPRAEAAMRII